MSKACFLEVIARFNHAKNNNPGYNNPGYYNGVIGFLSNTCDIHRVDFPKPPIKGTPDQIVKELNLGQAVTKNWPTMAYDPDPNNISDNGSWVTGTGVYTDAVGAQPVVVHYAYHFDSADKIDRVLAVPRDDQTIPGGFIIGPNPF